MMVCHASPVALLQAEEHVGPASTCPPRPPELGPITEQEKQPCTRGGFGAKQEQNITPGLTPIKPKFYQPQFPHLSWGAVARICTPHFTAWSGRIPRGMAGKMPLHATESLQLGGESLTCPCMNSNFTENVGRGNTIPEDEDTPLREEQGGHAPGWWRREEPSHHKRRERIGSLSS